MKSAGKIAFRVIIPLLLAAVSIFVITGYAVNPKLHEHTIASIDEKKTTVMELTAASTAAAAVISALPDDTGTPIAEQLADLSSYFLIVLSALYLEKYLTSITGYAAFTVLIPLACLLYSANVFYKEKNLKNAARKIIILAVAIMLVVPCSAKVSDIVENTYNDSIEETISLAIDTTESLSSASESEEEGLKGVISSVKGKVNNAINEVKTVLNRFVEALAVMIVTSCLIPIVVLLFFIWLVKYLAGVNINLPRLPRRRP